MRIEATVAGHLLGYVLARRAGGGSDIVLLMSPARHAPSANRQEESTDDKRADAQRTDSAPCDPAPPPAARAPEPMLRLVRFTPEGKGRLETLRDDLPRGTMLIAAIDSDGDGDDEILLEQAGRLLLLPALRRNASSAEASVAVADPEVVGPAVRGVLRGDEGFLPLAILGGVRFYGPESETGAWRLLAEVPLPVRAGRVRAGLRLTSPLIREVGEGGGGRVLFAAGPEPHGRRRLRTLLVDPTAGARRRSMEVWSLLPSAEKIMESAYMMIARRPVLLVTTRPAEKLSLFGEKKLRLFHLDEPDRSRAGSPPFLAVETHINIWQAAAPVMRDADGDGTQDLVLGYWKGIKDDRIVLDMYRGVAAGGFDTSPRTTQFDVEDADRSVLGYGEDLDGDKKADLLLRAGDRFRIFRGRHDARGGRALVEKKPRWSMAIATKGRDDRFDDDDDYDFDLGEDGENTAVAVGPRYGRARIVDLDADGLKEILVLGRFRQGATRLNLLRLSPPSASTHVQSR
ncbi:MAG: hypothetical protein ACE5HU_01520 [Acidobacteriota bacterium]